MGDEADADWQDGLVEWGIEDARAYYTNRERKTAPKRSKYWCDRCDRDVIGHGRKCLVCGFRDTTTKHAKP